MNAMSDFATREKNRTYYQEHRGTDPQSHKGMAKEKPGKIPGVSKGVLE